jgi:dTDP-4-amino-4,6-dideoxygalactose transaminase
MGDAMEEKLREHAGPPVSRPARTTFLGIAKPDLRDAEIDEILETLRSGWLTAGPKVQRFQELLTGYVGSPVRVLNSATAGLTLALRLLDVGRGDEVLMPVNTFVACANAIELLGARPVFVDSEPGTGLIDLAHAATLVSPRTKAIMPVHLGGRPLDLDALAAFRERHGITVVEDGAHAIGAAWHGRPVGSWGNLCAFSFHATKNITTFEGGALAVRDAAEAERVECLALQGLSRSGWERHKAGAPHQYDVIEPGYKFTMSDVSAATGIHQLGRLDEWIDRREQIAGRYDELLSGLPLELPTPVPSGVRHARHLYSVLVDADAPISRDDLAGGLREHQIGSSVHFQGVHLMTYYRETYGLAPEDFPVATDWARRSISLPLHHQLTDDDVHDVATAVATVLGLARAAA